MDVLFSPKTIAVLVGGLLLLLVLVMLYRDIKKSASQALKDKVVSMKQADKAREAQDEEFTKRNSIKRLLADARKLLRRK